MQSILKSVIGPKKEFHDLGGRVALITGGALGIGLVPSTPNYSIDKPNAVYFVGTKSHAHSSSTAPE